MSTALHGTETADALRPYRTLLEHAELELELAGRGDLDGLTELAARWEDLVREVPERAGAEAAPLLARAHLIHQRTRIELARLREGVLGELSLLAQARRAADGYAGQLQRPPRVDRSA